ncbi:hypothetical protein V5N11_034267 [Cardamine amara subsp. amara]|uniref:Uncharacterized protein n=1 Tax=Cardamine amara subsp. amara TaxID=228776 RepID=A0ABD1AUL9_CARAN
MKKTTGNGCRLSLSSMKSSLCDSIIELSELCHRTFGLRLKSIEIQILAIKYLTRLRKEAIPKGKIHSFLNFPTLIRIWMTQSEMDSIENSIARISEVHMKLVRRLQTELISDINKCLLQEEANNRISPEMAVVLSPSLTMEIGVNNQLRNDPEPSRSESKTDNSGLGEPGTKVT